MIFGGNLTDYICNKLVYSFHYTI